MRFLIIALLLLIPVMVCGADKKVQSKATAEKRAAEESKKELEQDICFSLSEYVAAKQQAPTSYRPSSPGGRLARDADQKGARLMTLQGRYAKRYGSEFNAYMNPSLCPGF